MKRFLNIFAISAILFCSCGGSEQGGGSSSSTSLNLSTYSLEFEAERSSLPVTVITSGAWTVSSSDSDWLSVTPDSGSGTAQITIIAEANTGGSRSAKVNVVAEGAKYQKTVSVTQKGSDASLVAIDSEFDGTKRSGTTYQILVYNFCDSNNDGIGDFNGITSKLDYLDEMGATALWLSPIHPSSSYHGYEVDDYYSVNSKFGTEEDLKNLITKAKAKNIDIYLDYVLNHSGKNNAWFQTAMEDESSKYRNYYMFSSDPATDISNGKFAMVKSYDSGTWYPTDMGVGTSGHFKFTLDVSDTYPKVTVSETTESTSYASSGTWNIWYGDSKCVYFNSTGTSTYEAILDFDSSWGFLIRSANSWETGVKHGSKSGNQVITLGTPFTVYPSESDFDPQNIVFSEPVYYNGQFYSTMPDFNYGEVESAEQSGAFKDLAASAKKWIDMGVAGLRLDAVKHIYQDQASANYTFLSKWYDECNSYYKAAGNSGDIFMVGEVLSGHGEENGYYRGLPSLFEFDFWWKLKDMLNKQNISEFPATVMGYIKAHKSENSNAQTCIKLSNHDENRTASELGLDDAKVKQAAAILLTSEGKAFIYQGEELGYYGTKDGGDEYVRTPMKWTKTGKVADGLMPAVDNSMLTSYMSVEAQKENSESILNVYKTFSKVRNTYPALAQGTMSAYSGSVANSIAAWYMTDTEGNKMLVFHNASTSSRTLIVEDDMSKPVAILGKAYVSGNYLTLDGNSSVVFKLY